MRTTAVQVSPEDFVRNVLVVDDQVYGERGDVGEGTHPLDTRQLINSLATRGVSCVALELETTEDLDIRRVVALARNCDVLILDWTLSPDKSINAAPLIKSIVADDQAQGGHLRLIVVYTGYEDPNSIVDDVVEDLTGLGLEPKPDGLTVKADNVAVVVRIKPNGLSGMAGTTETELADSLVGMFVDEFASGLLPRVAMAGAAAVRRDVQQVLAHFKPTLDRAYLSHRGMTSPFSGEQFALQLVCDEITTTLLDAQIDRWVQQDRVDDWLATNLTVDVTRHYRRKSKGVEKLDTTAARSLLSRTLAAPAPEGGERPPAYTLTSLFDSSGDEASALLSASEPDERFTLLATYSRHVADGRRNSVVPRLGLGTVLEGDGRYWMCLQPLCDGARLDPDVPTKFPLAPVSPVKDPSAKFDLLVPTESAPLRATLTLKLKELELPLFAPVVDSRGQIEATADDGRFVFTSTDGRRYTWHGQLRLDLAHRFAAHMGSSAGRIGLDEPEWSRQQAPR